MAIVQTASRSGATARGQRALKCRVETIGPPQPDGDGGFVEQWVALNPPDWWAAVDNLTTGHRVRDQEHTVSKTIETTALHLLRGDWRPDITTVCRVWVPDLRDPTTLHRYDIMSVAPVAGAPFEMLVTAAEYRTDHDPRPVRA
jgi:hypothetical protein